LVRRGSELVPATWEEALKLVAEHFRDAGDGLFTMAGGRLANEDLFNLRGLTAKLGGKAALYTSMAGGELVAQVGVGQGTNFADMGAETAILVVASDLLEEAPVWWLRVKQAAERGAQLIVANGRPTKLERYAKHAIHYTYGAETAAVLAMANALSAKRPNLPEAVQNLLRSAELQAAAKAFAEAENAVILFGSEGVGLEASQSLAQACANLLITTGHVGKPNNGLIGVWPHANDQGARDLGFRPQLDLKESMRSAKALYVIAADPAGDDPALAETGEFLVVQELFLTATAKLADVVLPVQAFTEREGSYTSGERRVQRFFPAVPERPGSKADFTLIAEIGKLVGVELEGHAVAKIMLQIAESVPDYAGLSYLKLSEVTEQWPIFGRGDLYYGGTGYENKQGLGFQLPSAAQRGVSVPLTWPQLVSVSVPENGLLAVPVTRLYDRGQTVMPSKLLQQRIPQPFVALHPAEADRLKLAQGDMAELSLNGSSTFVLLRLDENLPAGVALVPRSLGIPISGPIPAELRAVEKAMA